MNLIIILALISFSVQVVFGQQQETRWTVTQFLDQGGKYQATWTVDLDRKDVEFQVEVETLGFIGFGMSTNGAMAGADIVIGGIQDNNGTAYFTDRHGTGNVEPEIDTEKNWDLISASQNATHTILNFKRVWDTCDKHNQDVVINDDTLKIIWSYGPTDSVQYHSGNRGASSINLLDYPTPPQDLSKFKKWRLVVNDVMPAQHTSYLCSIHKEPSLNQTHHIVGIDALLENGFAIEYAHHITFFQCDIPNDDVRNLLDSHVGQPAFDCKGGTGNPNYPARFCEKSLFIWATGGQRTMLPEHVGLPIRNDNENQAHKYVMMEVHYNNPNLVANRVFETGMEVYYTDVVRNETGDSLVLGQHVWWAHTIPPMSNNFLSVGHCSSQCTQELFPEDGINVFFTLLHSHLSGRKIKVRHFRNGQELPWLAVDGNYDFNFQQNRPTRPEIKILRGDQLTVECNTDTTWKNSSVVTIGDIASTDEMCEAVLIYYPSINISRCQSSIPSTPLLQFFGITNVTANPFNYNDPLVTDPPLMANKSYTQVLNTMIDWNPEFRSKFQEFIRYKTHDAYCSYSAANPTYSVSVKYPIIEQEYQPIDQCHVVDSAGSNNLLKTGKLCLLWVFLLLKSVVNEVHFLIINDFHGLV